MAKDFMMRWAGGEDCLILARMDRKDETRWQNTRSCLGGLPAVSAKDWPRTDEGPMHCAAQIDCAEARAAFPGVPLPARGTLVFFVGCLNEGWIGKGAVRYLPEGAVAPALPADFFPQPPVAMYGAGLVKLCQIDESLPKHFPRWPVRLARAHQRLETYTPSLDEILGQKPKSVHLDMEGFTRMREDEHIQRILSSTGQVEQVKTNVSRREEQDFAPHCARVAQVVAKSVLSRLSAAPASAAAAVGEFERVCALIEHADPLKPLGAALDAEFLPALRAVHLIATKGNGNRYVSLPFGSGTVDSADAAKAVYFSMYTGTRAEYLAIPAAMRAQIEATRLRSGYSPDMAHQMLSFGRDLQGQLDYANLALLLQLATDDAMSFMWGDCGLIQYMIPHGDLAKGNWDAATMLMQGN